MSIGGIAAALEREKYICGPGLAEALFVALVLPRPLLVEGAAGVGKTEVAKAMAAALGRPLVRLQCHAGMDETRALYEWNYQKQLLALQVLVGSRTSGTDGESKDGVRAALTSIFSEEYLLERPLLASIRSDKPVVLLVDELDKTDEEFEAFLLELLAEFQVTIPELGVVRARSMPFVVLTSNSTRQLSDALRRRCVFAYLAYPDVEREILIINTRFPGANAALARQVAEASAYLRGLPRILKKPSIAESLDWLAALTALGRERLDREAVRATLGAVLKNREDFDEAMKDDKFLDLH
ncbi:MAG: MoxR family ATPase [Synergistaceae bacterium]|nr:MoxR family ATPase [Synergistaceae bacterium]